MAIKNEILDELLKDKDPKTIFSSEGLLGELKKALAERVLNAEMDHHLADSTQDSIVHLIRNSLDFCSCKDRKPVAQELKTIYRAEDAEAAAAALKDFEEGPFGKRFAAITAMWRRNWAYVIPFFAYPQEVRKMIYTTNAIESLNAKLRRSVRIRGHFPNDEAAMKLIWLQLREITKNWKMPPREWSAAKAQFAVVFGDRFEVNR